MKKWVQTCLIMPLLVLFFSVKAQDETPSRWRGFVNLGQYAAKIGAPSFHPFRLGVNLGASYHLNKNEKHQLRQSFHLGGFYHRDLQTAIQLYSEFQYEWHVANFSITPLAIGAGYVASVSDMTSLKWDGTKYEKVAVPLRNNFMMSLGSNLGYESPLKVANQPISFSLAYRLQVQGIIVKAAVPVMAYSSVQIGLSMPLVLPADSRR